MLVGREGAPELLSDYDIFVVNDDPPSPGVFRNLEVELTPRLWGPKVTLGSLATRQLPTLPLTLWTYDLRYGSRVVAGDPELLTTVPSYRSQDIPAWEGLKLLFNYSAVLLGALGGETETGQASAREGRVVRESLLRMVCRIGDALVIQDGCYHHLLACRPEALRGLTTFRSLEPAQQELILWGCREKLAPHDFATFDVDVAMRSLFSLLDRVLCDALRRFLNTENDGLPALTAAYRRRFRTPLSWWGRISAHVQRLVYGDPDGLPWQRVDVDRYHYVLAIAPLVLLSMPGFAPERAAYLVEACRLLGISSTPAVGDKQDVWKPCRDKALHLWNAVSL
ncbi:MAG: hypothetical protein WC713_01955 [Candidatus Methylomirabilota bacterium]